MALRRARAEVVVQAARQSSATTAASQSPTANRTGGRHHVREPCAVPETVEPLCGLNPITFAFPPLSSRARWYCFECSISYATMFSGERTVNT